MPLAAENPCLALGYRRSSPQTTRHLGNAGSDVIQAYKAPAQTDRAYYLQWAAGFATAVAISNKITDVLPTADTLDLVDMSILICREHDQPGYRWKDAVLESIARLKPFWSTEPTTTIINYDGKSAKIYQQAIQPLQKLLAARGFTVKPDGTFGNQTGQALMLANKSLGLPPSPFPNGVIYYYLTNGK